MRKLIALVSVLTLMVAVSFPVEAASKAYTSVWPNLSISGTTATCSLTVYAGNTADSIEATVTLKRGNTTVKQWSNLSASGYMNFSDTASVSRGNTYTMQVTLKINGVPYAVDDITKKCN